MSVLRTCFYLGILVVLLPTDEGQQSRLKERLSDVAQWTVTFCERNPNTCARGRELRETFSEKAEFGAKLVYAAVTAYIAGGDRSDPGLRLPTSGEQAAPTAARHNTLTPSDLAPSWRGRGNVRGGA